MTLRISSLRVLMLATAAMVCLSACRAEEPGTEDAIQTDYYQQENYSLELSYPAGQVDFGETVKITLKLEYPDDEDYILLPPPIDSGEEFSNTMITGVVESGPVFSGTGTAVSTYEFLLEAWLPGELVFPPLKVRFMKEISTDPVVITVVSVFSENETEHSLAPIYVPSQEEKILSGRLIIISAALVILVSAIVVTAVIFVRRKREKAAAVVSKSREELIEEFRRKYIETEESYDVREALSELERIPGITLTPVQREAVDAARFSRDEISREQAVSILNDILPGRTGEGDDDL